MSPRYGVHFIASPAAGSHATNGRIVFVRYNPSLDDTILYTVNPSGTQLKRVAPQPLQCPHWSPDGTRIATCTNYEGGATAIINPRAGHVRLVPMPDPTLFTACFVWSPDAARLACESLGTTDSNRNGLYTIRTSDGPGLRRVAPNPGGDDIPGSYAPHGHRLLFGRYDQNSTNVGLFTVAVDGSELRWVTPRGMLVDGEGDWSPQGNEIVFAGHANPNVRDSIWVIHPNGTGLHEIRIKGHRRCGGAFTDPASRGCFGPQWSPDGKKLVFGVNTAADGENIYIANIDAAASPRSPTRAATKCLIGARDPIGND